MFRKTPSKYKVLEKRLGYVFKRKSLLKQALIHRSYRFENTSVNSDNQRLEFLGDAALGLIAAAEIFSHFDDSAEGVMTCVRSRITSGKALARIGADLDLGTEILLGKGEEKSGGRTRSSNITDALEALIGAAYLDGGMKAVEKIFRKVFMPELVACESDMWSGNPKGKLQEICQRKWRSSPKYHAVAQNGPSHARIFTVEVIVNGDVMAVGEGRSKQDAETSAANDALQQITE